jgi:alpha-galactosidase
MRTIAILLLCITVSCSAIAQKYENLAPTPPMGWNSWNIFQTNISEEQIRGIADQMVSTGMRDAGYQYLVLDDGWMSMQRDSITGDLVADPKKFPHGMKALSDYVHSKGLKFGLYNCAGTKTCAGYPGTRGYEYQDARFYASVGIDYLKFDWCYADSLNVQEAYGTMAKALRAARRPIIFSLCEWGSHQPWLWAAQDGQLWRSTGDIGIGFQGVLTINQWHPNSVMKCVELNEPLRQYAGPNHWNDPDMLEVGNGMTVAEDRAHFSLWCMMAAPLISGNDIRKMTPSTSSILTNKAAIAIDQDALGIQGWRYASKDSTETWFKPLSNGDWAVCFLNRSAQPVKVNFDWMHENVKDELSGRSLDAAMTTYKVMDVWSPGKVLSTKKAFSSMVGSHDVVMVRLVKS